MAKRIVLEHVYNRLGKAANIKNFNILILVIGGSGKALGVNGVNISDEIERCDTLIEKAREEKMYILGIHIGGLVNQSRLRNF